MRANVPPNSFPELLPLPLARRPLPEHLLSQSLLAMSQQLLRAMARSRVPSLVSTWEPPTLPSPSWRARHPASLKTQKVSSPSHCLVASIVQFCLQDSLRCPYHPFSSCLCRGWRATGWCCCQATGRGQPREHPLRHQAIDRSQVQRC